MGSPVLHDLSHPLRTGMPVYPGDPAVAVGPALTVDADGVNVLALHLGSQSGTHVDAPFHVDDALPDLDALPEGGMGLFIIRSFMDEVRHNALGNEITMIKRRK